ncbi:MAG TPA: biotin/lipoate A/B protein ligase family protein [Dissulfurispiraceae bacterium]|nr:biotin/lipoate A/B protein ligase family protein [Dissulfurispiraceae bacterium]
MALDEAIALTVRAGTQPPTLRLYTWTAPSVSLGVFQNFSDIDLRLCTDLGIQIVRRPTGGRAILHGNELTYSFSARNEGVFARGLYPAFYALSSAFAYAFRSLGLAVAIKKRPAAGAALTGNAACFASISYGELTVAGAKIIGSAQKRWPDGFLQQGCIPYVIDNELESRIFRQLPGAGVRSALKDFVNPIAPLHVEAAIIAGFEEAFRVRMVAAQPSVAEQALAQRLVLEKYQSEEWTRLAGRSRGNPSRDNSER